MVEAFTYHGRQALVGRFRLIGGALLTVVGATAVASPAPAADPALVVISELMYHSADGASGDDALYDYVELANVGGESADLTGWRFSAGIDGVLPALALSPGDFVVVARDGTWFAERYGQAPDAVWTSGNLSNGGEAVELRDATDAVVDAVTYSDSAPWPGTPDGNGPSLERLDLALANTNTSADAANWLASSAANGTPGTANSVLPLLGAAVIDAVDDGAERPAAGVPVPIHAAVRRATSVVLEYRVMFGAPVQIPMGDDAASAGGAGDGVYTALVPPQGPRTLVRYRVLATGSNTVVRSSPEATDSIGMHGVVTSDPSTPTDLPVIDWYMVPADYTLMLAQHRYDDRKFPIVVAVGDQVLENGEVRVRGGATRKVPKPSLKMELPSGYEMAFPGVPDPVDEFNLYYRPDPTVDMAWQIVEQAGMIAMDFVPVRSYQNGVWHGTGAYLTATDGRHWQENGLDDAAVYKQNRKVTRTATAAGQMAYWEKDRGVDGDFSDIWAFVNGMTAPKSASRSEFIWEQTDVPAMVNYMAFVSFTRHWDAAIKNVFLVRTPAADGRWRMEPWDLDGTFWPKSRRNVPSELLPPRTHAFTAAMLDDPIIKAMWGRRLRSLIDEWSQSELTSGFDATYAQVEAAWNQDWNRWHNQLRPSAIRSSFMKGVPERYALFAANTGPGKLIPPSATGASPIQFGAIVTSPVSGQPQTVQLRNTSTTESIDLTGWRIDGIDLALTPGTVLLPGQVIVFSNDDVTLRSSTVGLYTGGEFAATMSPGTNLVLRDATGLEIAATVA